MSIATPIVLHTPNSNSLIATLTVAVAAGEPIIVVAWVANTRTWTSVTDSASNIYTILETAGAGNNRTMIIAYCANPSALSVGQTIQANISSSTIASSIIVAMKVTGLMNPSYDKSAHTNPTTSASYSIGPTATLSQALEIAIYAVAQDAETNVHTPTSPWISLVDFQSSQSTAARIGVGYQIVNATTALTATGTTSNGQYVGVLATFKGAPTTQRQKIKLSGSFATKTAKIKLSGSFVEKPIKVKVGGTFV